MKSTRRITYATAALVGAALLASAAAPAMADDGHGDGHDGDRDHSRHVLLLSVDGLHQKDLNWYVHAHPNSELAGLVAR